jgi:hypothetical protein
MGEGGFESGSFIFVDDSFFRSPIDGAIGEFERISVSLGVGFIKDGFEFGSHDSIDLGATTVDSKSFLSG